MRREEVQLVLGRAEGLAKRGATGMDVGVLGLRRHEGSGVDGVFGREAKGVELEAGGHKAGAEGLEVRDGDAPSGVKREQPGGREGALVERGATTPRLARAGRTRGRPRSPSVRASGARSIADTLGVHAREICDLKRLGAREWGSQSISFDAV